jgi:hypothetical protein
MEDVTIAPLFARMDAHLARQDAHLAAITETLGRQNAALQAAAQLLAQIAREVTVIHAEASRLAAETLARSEALTARLESRPWGEGGGRDDRL